MTINLKIEIIKIFTFEFSLSSDKDLKFKKEKSDEKVSPPESTTSKPASSSK
jgi:hypothetical protein